LRIAKLELVAFGPFTERVLELSGGAPGGLHLVYGRNAAGKSSALRAISDLLFGFPPKSSDDHVHPYAALRIRARLEDGNGDGVVLQRLKRNKDSLRDEHDAPIDEIVLRRLLGSVDRGMFERVFGLDHERLRDAGQALLEGGGDVGESLFDAGAGGHGVRRVLARLREDADKLFKPRGGRQEIAQLLEGYKAARDRVRNGAHAPDAYVDQERELERHRGESERMGRELSELRQEREHCRRLQGALRAVAKRQKLLSELAALGTLPDLPPEFGERRERVLRGLSTHELNVARLRREIERLEQRRGELKVPEGLLVVGEDSITSLREGVGSTKKALADLPAREAALAERRAEAQVMERRLGIASARWTHETLRARRPEEARFRRLLGERAALGERGRAARERLAQVELDLETRRARLSALPRLERGERLERAVVFARQAGDVEAALNGVRRDATELAVLSRSELAMLAPFDGTLAELCALRVPASETVGHFEKSFADNAEQQKRAEDALARCRERAAELNRELAAEERAGAVPSERELERARRVRDERFDELYRSWPEKPGKSLSLFESARVREYRGDVVAADGLADRLRREAARVAENARRSAELEQMTQEQQRLAQLQRTLAEEERALARAWASSWAAAGFEPVGPAEMRGWLARRERAVALVVKEASLGESRAELERRRVELVRVLAEALGPLPEGVPLAVSVERAQELLDGERRVAAERSALEAQLAELEVHRERARNDLETSERDRTNLEARIAEAIVSLGFDAALAPEEVESRLEALAELVAAQKDIADLERRISGMERDVRAFQAEVEALVTAHAPELGGASPQRAALELVARFDRGRRDAEVLERLSTELAECHAELAEETALLERARADAEGLLAAAGVVEFAELSIAEQRTRAARELRAELDGLEATLTEIAGAQGLPALLDEASRTDPARLTARLEELDTAIEKQEERYETAIRAHQRIQAGLERFADTSAVEAAEEERALAAALVARSERWARLKLAEVLLAREIERYREQHQGPVLRRAAELFRQLTREEYRGLRVGREERALVAVRSDDMEVTVQGLNEAARYHLYLALRLASLERYLEHAEPLPLVLDDVLIHFDEEGARAALSVLGDLADRVQILLFTHHRHNLLLADAVVPAGRLFVHDLSA